MNGAGMCLYVIANTTVSICNKCTDECYTPRKILPFMTYIERY